MEEVIKEFNRKMNRAIIVCVGLVILGTTGMCIAHVMSGKGPNNVYQLECYPRYFILKDGKRTVDTIPVTSAGRIDSVILNDNQ